MLKLAIIAVTIGTITKMSNSWVVLDTHFFHANILTFDGGRPEFSSAEEMNEVMIERWNSVVKHGDKVYHLGDVAMGPGAREGMAGLIARLNGSKRLIVGNHDDILWLSKGGWFKKVALWRNFKEHNLIMTHLPLHAQTMESRWGGKALNVHGHIHRKLAPSAKHYCVSVEQIGYTPVALEELAAIAKKRIN